MKEKETNTDAYLTKSYPPVLCWGQVWHHCRNPTALFYFSKMFPARLIVWVCVYLLQSLRYAAMWPLWRNPKPTPPQSRQTPGLPGHRSLLWRSRQLEGKTSHPGAKQSWVSVHGENIFKVSIRNLEFGLSNFSYALKDESVMPLFLQRHSPKNLGFCHDGCVV